jgi:hypothetical protein
VHLYAYIYEGVLASEDRKSYKNRLRISNHTNFDLYKSYVLAPLFFYFIISFSSWLCTVLTVLIFLRRQSAVNLQCWVQVIFFSFPHFSHFCCNTYSFQHSITFRTFRTTQ